MLVCKIKKNIKGFSLDVDFSAGCNVTALLGASGSGKSMTLRCIAGISKPDEGRIELNGKVLFDSKKKINLPPQKRNTGFLFQDFALFPNMTVRQNIICGAGHIPRDKRKDSADEMAESFHIADHLDKYPHQLSGGEKQRCALARILIGSPDILMLDEPFASLDSHLCWELEEELAALFKRFPQPVLYVSHNQNEINRLCDAIVLMNNGKNSEYKIRRQTMTKIAVYANRYSQLCDFFEAERILVFERSDSGWEKTGETGFEKIVPSTPALTRKNTEALLPLIDGQGCNVLAGGGLYGIPFSVFDRTGLHIFEIATISGEIFDSIIEDIDKTDAVAAAKEAIIKDTKPVETDTPGVYFLDLVALQKECPEISSKRAMMDFLQDTPFTELRLICKHIPPWIENSGAYNIETISRETDKVTALITKRC